MAKTSKKVDSLFIQEQNKDFLKPEYIDVPNTTIINRAQMVDLSQDLGVRMGINRIQTHSLVELKDEVGANGEAVYGVANDKFNQVRFVGAAVDEENDTNGPRGQLNAQNEYIEVTFYGTGLNVIMYNSSFARDLRATVDGGAEGANFVTAGADNLDSRRYPMNIVMGVVSGLTLGLHTVKIRQQSAVDINIFGFEFLNENAQLNISKGSYFNDGKLLRLLTEQNISYNSDWTNETGVAGSKGGCVSVYLTESGAVKKDIQWTNATAQFLGSTDHSNEEIIGHHNYREFGSGRSDDFSMAINSGAHRGFTLEDGTTTLSGAFLQGGPFGGVAKDGLRPESVGSYFVFTFVGTGLDIENEGVTGGTTFEVFVDNVSQGTFSTTYPLGIRTICSGLAYGTHVVKVAVVGVPAGGTSFNNFIVYGPKKPVVEDSSVELASYFLMADYVGQVTVTPSPEFNRGEIFSQGVLRKQLIREMNYNGTWIGPSVDPGWNCGFQFTCNTNNDYIEYTFVGTGIDFGYTYSTTPNVKVQLNGADLGTTGTVVVENGSYNDGTSIITETNNPLFKLTDLSYGKHTIRFFKTAGTNFIPAFVDVHSLIHTPKRNKGLIIQNTNKIGSQSIGDSRKLAKEEKDVYKSIDIIGGITVAQFVQDTPLGDTSSHFYLEEETTVEIGLETRWTASAFGGQPEWKFWIDGKQYEYSVSQNLTTANWQNSMYIYKTLKLAKGWHSAFITVYTGAGGTVSSSSGRQITIKKVS